MSNRKALVIMLKNPVKGKVKTRLAKETGDELAFDVYKNLLSHTQKITAEIDADKYIYPHLFLRYGLWFFHSI